MGVRDAKKTWFLTYPQNDATTNDLLDKLTQLDKIVEYIIAREQHKDGSNHLHAYVKFEVGYKLKDAPSVFNLLAKTGNYQPTRSCIHVIKYCTKGSDYITNFDVDKYKAKKGKVTTTTLRSYTAMEALDAGIISLGSLKSYEYGRSLAIEPYIPTDVRGVWFHGAPGTGKSLHARRLAGDDVYLKAQNKWWDGYTGQKTVILDDLDNEFKSWHNLKIWTDRYPCFGEIKGGQVALSYDRFIVTSNYHYNVLIGDDNEELKEAINRRFKVTKFSEPFKFLKDKPVKQVL